MNVTWTIKPLNTPTIVRNCSHCGRQCEFECSGNFRINAQQKRLDVWLIYKCSECDCTLNMDIFSRVNPNDLPRALYEGFLKNSAELAFQYAFDVGMLAKNKATACYDHITYVVEGDDITLEALLQNQVSLQIRVPYNLQVRLDRILSEKLHVTRSALKPLFDQGIIKPENAGTPKGSARFKLKENCTIQFNPAENAENVTDIA